jgi:Methane oxygenase PmoA
LLFINDKITISEMIWVVACGRFDSALDRRAARILGQRQPNKGGSMNKHFHQPFSILVVAMAGLLPALRPACAESWRVTVRGADTDVGETPVVVALKLPLGAGIYFLESGSGGDPIPAQVFENGDGAQLATVLPSLAAGVSHTYSLAGPITGSDRPVTGLSFEASGRNLRISLDQRLFTEYRVDAGNKPFFFPLIGPTGESYTREYPLSIIPDEDHDHPHQRSCWFTYGNVNGIDFWSEGKRFGTVKEKERTLVVAGPVVGRLKTLNDWRAADDQKVCTDERTVTFYRTKSARIIDFKFRIVASEGPVEFHDTKEGMFGLRVASSMDVDKKMGGKITNAEGLTNEKAWGKPSPWVDYVGPVKDRTVGIAIINHPSSFRYPTTWHVRTYGLFAANPFGWHDFGRPDKGDYMIPGGQALEFSYRVVLHEGDTMSAGIPARLVTYAKPPTIEVVKN